MLTQGQQQNLKQWLVKHLVPNPGTVTVVLLLLWVQSTGAAPWLAPAAAPSSASTINYQGRLFDSGGNAVNGSVNLTFSLYNQASGGSSVWGPETHNGVAVSDGLFSVLLGSQLAIPLSAVGGDLWLETKVNSETLSPREQLGAVPVAMTVRDGSITTTKIIDGAVTSDKLSRQIHKATLASDIQMPNANTWYNVLSLTINLERETLVTIQASIGCANNTTDTFFRNSVVVDSSEISISDQWNKGGIGEQAMMSTSLLLGPGQHQIRLRVHSWATNSYITGDARTQLVVVEG